MRKICLFLFFLLFAVKLAAQTSECRVYEGGIASPTKLKKVLKSSGTNFVFVRHAEKQLNSSDPALNSAGEVRAQKLSKLLRKSRIDRILATQYRRTQQTVAPTATSKKISVQTYQAADGRKTVQNLAESKENILIVGHSNTLHVMLNTLVGKENITEFSEKDYDNLYIVSVLNGQKKVYHFRF